MVLRMSREDWDHMLMLFGAALTHARNNQETLGAIREYRVLEIHSLLDRLNSGNPNYRPYLAGEKV